MRKTNLVVTLSVILSIVVLFLLPAQFPVAAEGPADTPTMLFAVRAGEQFQFQFTAPASFPTTAWIGLIPSNVPHGNEAVNDENDVAYQYLEGRTSGLLTFEAPNAPGLYDLRMHDTDRDGKEVASVTFVVTTPPEQGAKLWLDKTSFAPAEVVDVHFVAPDSVSETAWVGIIPSDVPHGSSDTNDEHDVDYQWVKPNTSGTLSFLAPDEPGSYDFRMNDSDHGGKEIASVTFTVIQ